MIRNPQVLIVEDDVQLKNVLSRLFERKGFSVITATRIEEVNLMLSKGFPIDLALIDVHLPDGDGISLVQTLKAKVPQRQCLVFTGEDSPQLGVRATEQGAFSFLTKPFNMDEVVILCERALALQKLSTENKRLKTELTKKHRTDSIIGDSDPIQEVHHLISQVSKSDSTILITGQSGSGKELIARSIHYNSDRADQAFIAINCGAIPAELLESEFFGHVKGAFTGAIANRAGRFELADGGTIFLDEIGDLQPSLQVKILRVLQEKSFEPVGSTKTLQADVRVIAATNKNLEELVEKGQFREDLFYRLNVIPINVPSLKERKQDIPLLLTHFLNHFNRTKNKSLQGFTPEALNSLSCYPWPGNIRELENLVERLAILKGSGVVDTNDLPPKYRQSHLLQNQSHSFDIPEEGLDFNAAVDQFENNLILKALEKTNWNRNQAAQLLRLNRTTLVEKLKKKGIRGPGETAEETTPALAPRRSMLTTMNQ